jgi:hypothetical protein
VRSGDQSKEQDMKPSHLTTPRTLADCTFTTGYNIAEPRSRYIPAPAVIIACIALGALLWTLL